MRAFIAIGSALIILLVGHGYAASVGGPVTGVGGSATNAQPPSATLTNIANSGFTIPYFALSTNGGSPNYVTSVVARSSSLVVSNDATGIASLHLSTSAGGGGTNFPNINLLVGGTNLTLSAGVRKAYHNQTNGSHGINLNLAVPESGYEVVYSVSNSGSSAITVTFFTNSVAANPYDIATKTNVNTFTAAASAITKVKLTYAANGLWLLEQEAAPTPTLKFGTGITAVTNGVNELDVTISASTTSRAVLAFGCDVSMGPADSTTYYLGKNEGTNLRTTFSEVSQIIPYDCTVTRVVLHIFCTAGSSEDITVNVTDGTTDSSTWNVSIVNGRDTYDSGAISYGVTAGEELAIELLTPAWATNPTIVFMSADVYVTF